MFTFRYIGYFDLKAPLIRIDEYEAATPNVARPLPREVFDKLAERFPFSPGTVKWYYGGLLTFLALPGEWHPFERALIEEAECACLNMRLEVLCRPGSLRPIIAEVWKEPNYLKLDHGYYWHWCDVFAERLGAPHKTDAEIPKCLQSQLLYTSESIWFSLSGDGGRVWNEARDIFLAWEEFVATRLSDGTFDSRVRKFIPHAFAGLNSWLDQVPGHGDEVMDNLDRLRMLAYHWCRLHPIPLPPLTVAW